MDARLDRVLAEMEWVRRLAGSLARDEIAADEVAQETWLVASERAPDDELPLRPWLARVVHNLVRMRHRRASRRDARERAAPIVTETPTPHDLLERVEAQRAIADEVIALAEPYREVVLLHYVEGVPTNEIARRLDVPPGTVRRRLKVARDQLRERLRRGDRIALVLLLAVARSRAARATPFVIGAITMKKLLAVLALLVLLFVGRSIVHRHRDGARTTDPRATSVAATRLRARGSAGDVAIAAGVAVAPHYIAGRVVAGGAPVPNAIVRLGVAPFPADDGELDAIAVVRTDAAGRFDFGTRSVRAATVTAEAPEHAVAWLRLDAAPAPDRLVLELGDCTTRVFGVVRDAVGGPIANARIATAGIGGFDAARDGSFAVCMHPGWVRVDAESYGSVGFEVTVTGRVHHDVVLVPEGILTGTVADESGHPIAGAHVAAFLTRSADGADRWIASDTDGRFRIAGLTPAHYRVIATAPGLGTRSETRVAVAAGAATPELHLVLVARARLAGRVVEHATSVAGARIMIVDRDDNDSYAISGLDGTFVLDGVPLGPIELGAATYRVISPRKLVVDRLAMKDVVLEVARLGAVHGRVTRGTAAVTDAEVHCGDARTFSDATGAYTLDELDGDKCQLSASADGQTSPLLPIVLTSEPQVVDIDLATSSTIRGIVVDAAGAPVADALVLAQQPAQPSDRCTASTGSGGEFMCSGLRGGDYEVAAYPEPGTRPFGAAGDARRDPIHVEPGAVAQVTLAVDAQLLTIRGTVVDDTGAPIADALVGASSSASLTGLSMRLEPGPGARTDATGAFEIDRLAAGTHTLRASASEGGEVMAPGIAAGDSGVELRIARAGSIAGDLVGFTTTPQVEFGRPSIGTHVATVDGTTFLATGLEPGTYWVEVYDLADEREADTATVVVPPGGTAHVTLAMRARGTVEATVLDSATHTPVAGLACHVAALTDGNMGCCGWLLDDPGLLSDVTGHVRLEAPAGPVRVFCMPSLRPPFPVDTPYSWSSGDANVPVGGTGYAQVLAVSRVYPRGDVGFGVSAFSQPAAITSIDPSGPAAASGLVVGDAILAIDGASVAAMAGNAVMTLATNHRPGSVLAVGTARGTFTIVVGSGALN
ncbi:MAG TPA: sigma-70 family RNA polymerase sigma factor [Kofleriaceae bacterium]|jgi:RNA polymerase sigma-70 factor (ECF subfamily)